MIIEKELNVEMSSGTCMNCGRSSCLSCGSSAQSITERVPPIIVKVKFPVVTHKSWDGLNNEAKSELILNEMLAKGYA